MKMECFNLNIIINAQPENNAGQHLRHVRQTQTRDAFLKTLNSIFQSSKIISPKRVSIIDPHTTSHSELQELVTTCSQIWNQSEIRLITDSTRVSDHFSLPELLENTGCNLEIRGTENSHQTELVEHLIQRWQRSYYFNVLFSANHSKAESLNSCITQFKKFSLGDHRKNNIQNSSSYDELFMFNGEIYSPPQPRINEKTNRFERTQNDFSPVSNNILADNTLQKHTDDDHITPLHSDKIKIGFCIPRMSMGGITRSLLTMMNASCKHTFEWSGVAIGNDFAFDPETAQLILEHCPIYSSMDQPDFSGLVTIVGNACQMIVDQSDVVNLWGYAVPNRELELTNWEKKPMLVVAHGQNEWTRKNIQTSLRFAGQSILTSVSQNGIQTFPERLRKDVNVIYNGVDINRCTTLLNRHEIRERWGIGPETIAIGYIGRFANGKNILAAAQAVSVLGSKSHAVYVGEGVENTQVINRVRNICGKRCTILPRTEDIGSILSGLDCLISASPSEGGPLVVAEAWLASCPVVSTLVGFIPELEEKYGPLVFRLPPNPTPEQLAVEVKNATKGGIIVQRAKEVALKEFGATQMVKRYESLISESLCVRQNEIPVTTHMQLDDNGIVLDHRNSSVPKISVVMPVYNSEKYIGESLESIRNQTFQDSELIIVHDGSTDDTLPVMCSHLERLGFENFLLINQPNSGTGSALNEGFRYVRGEYSTWWSADSNMAPHCLETLNEALDSSDVDFVYGDWICLNEETGKTQLRKSPEFDKMLLQRKCYLGVCWLWKHSLKKAAGEFQSEVCEDYDMHLKMAAIGTFQRVPSPLGTWRNHRDNVSNRICMPRGYIQGLHVSLRHKWKNSPIKVAYVCTNIDAAGVGWFHVEGVLENLSKISARHIVGYSTHLSQTEELKIGKDDQEIREVLDECDLIHLNLLLPDDNASLLDITPWLEKGKPVIFHMHGGHWPWDRARVNAFTDTYNATLISCTPGIEKLYPNARWMPNYIPIGLNEDLREASYYFPRSDWMTPRDPISVGFYHNYSLGKGGDLIRMMMTWIEEELGFKGLLTMRTRDEQPIPLREHLFQKKEHDILIDNITQGFIGMAGWEAMAQGQVVFARLDQYAVREYTKLGDGHMPPIVNVAWWDELAVSLIEMGKAPETLVDLKQRTRNWMLKYYNAKRIMHLWERLYLGVLDGVA